MGEAVTVVRRMLTVGGEPKRLQFRRLVRRGWLLLLGVVVGISAGGALGQALPAGIGSGGGQINVGSGYTNFQADYSKRRLGGYWIYANYQLRERISAEFEARVLRFGEEVGTHETTFLIGPRYTYPVRFTRPYGKLLIGEGKFHFPYDYAEGTYFVVSFGGGVDIPVRTSRWTVRPIDFEYQSWPNFTFGGLHPWGISTGASFRIR